MSVRVTIRYFEGSPHWKLAEQRVRKVLRDLSRADMTLEHQLIDSPGTAQRVAFRGHPRFSSTVAILLPPAPNRSV
jgi:hypothetical protein